jgi:hypothetical protein
VRVEGKNYVEALAKSFGESSSVPAALGGTCSCATCCVALEVKASGEVPSLAHAEAKQTEHPGLGPEDVVISVRYPHLQTLRVIILGLVCLWIVVAMVSGRS